jgi:hypothetical protein
MKAPADTETVLINGLAGPRTITETVEHALGDHVDEP